MSSEQKANKSKLILSFFADGPLWDNTVYVPAYPTGMSYFRPFRYRRKWISGSLCEELKECKSRNKLIGNEAVLAARFISERHKSMVLPIRAVEVTHIDFIPDNVCVYFRLGQFYLPDFDSELSKDCLLFASDADAAPKDCLFFRCRPVSLPALCHKGDDEDQAWINWTRALSKDKSLPISEKARRTVFIRISRMGAKQPLEINKIFTSWRKGPIYGFGAKEAQRYELVYLHRMPFLFESGESIPKFKMRPMASTSNWEFSNIDEEISSNYQIHVMTLAALAPSASWEQISIQPDNDKLATESSGEVYTIALPFNIKIARSFWHRFCTVLIWLILLGIILVVKDAVVAALKGEDFGPDLAVGFFTFLVIVLGYVVSQKKLLK